MTSPDDLQPWETELVGGVEVCNGKNTSDATAKRINYLVHQRLEQLGSRLDGMELALPGPR